MRDLHDPHGGTLTSIMESNRPASDFPPGKANGAAPMPQPGEFVRTPVFTLKDFLENPVKEIPCLLDPIMPKVGIGALVGGSDAGKSAWLRQLAFSVATGQPDFLGFPINADQRAALYVSTEDNETVANFFCNLQNRALGVPPESGRGLRFIFPDEHFLEEIDLNLTEQPAPLVVVDAYGDLLTGDGNQAHQVRQLLNGYNALARKHQCLIVFLHHTGKGTSKGAPSKDNVLGSQSFEAKCRFVFEIRPDNYDKKHLCIVKHNYLPGSFKRESYVLDFQDMVYSNTGERLPIEELQKGGFGDGERRGGSKSPNPLEMGDFEHFDVLRHAALINPTPATKADLEALLLESWRDVKGVTSGLSDKPFKQLLYRYENKGWLTRPGKGSRAGYKFTLPSQKG